MGHPIRRRAAAWSAAALILLSAAASPAGLGPENVAVVVNGDSWASRAVANAYVRLRNVPPCNVIYLRDLTAIDYMDVEDFRQTILKPVLSAIRTRSLDGQIDCIAYSADFPAGIWLKSDVSGTDIKPPPYTDMGSINGLTYLYEQVLVRRPGRYVDLRANRYHQRGNRWPGRAKGKHKDDGDQAADSAAPGGERAENGEAEGDAAGQQGPPPGPVPPTRPFRHIYYWRKGGSPGLYGVAGPRYYLSTVLACTSGWAGMTVPEAIANLERSAAADGTAPKGTIYYARNKNVRSLTRQWGFAPAVGALKELGVNAEIVDGILPRGKPDVAGCMVGYAAFDWAASGSRILPGAICEHLTSIGGAPWRPGHTPLTMFLRHGAAAASGTVAEPYAIQAKFPDPFIQVHYARGCTLAEAFYQSVRGPYQLLIVGDPLCAPWAKRPEVRLKGIEDGQGVASLREATVEVVGERKIGHVAWYVDGKRWAYLPAEKAFRISPRALDDGWHELRAVGVTGKAPSRRGACGAPPSGTVATHGGVTVSFVTRARGHSAKLVVLGPAKVPWDRPLRLRASAPEAERVAVLHNGRELASVEGAGGEVEIDALEVGPGVVRLQAVGHFENKWQARSKPVEVEIVAPAPRPALGLRMDENRREIQRMTKQLGWIARERKWLAKNEELLAEQAGWVKERRAWLDEQEKALTGRIEQLARERLWRRKEAIWLAATGIEAGRPFEIDGYFQVPADGVYQAQLRTNAAVTLRIDGEVLPLRGGRHWSFVPVALAAGVHRLQADVRCDKPAQVDLRFGGPGLPAPDKLGGPGVRKLDGKRFRHLPQDVPGDEDNHSENTNDTNANSDR